MPRKICGLVAAAALAIASAEPAAAFVPGQSSVIVASQELGHLVDVK